jgi:putative NIF3 family GTP cyclohydrolase 1 type 2
MTADEIIQRIKVNVGVPWRTETVDKIIAGSGATAITGIATTMMAALEVIKRAAAAGKNMVITHEPTFYSHLDTTESLAQDPTYQFKADFIRAHDIVVFRFHDHWHAHRPDGIATGMVRALEWQKKADPERPRTFLFPGTPLATLAKDIQTRLKIRTVRVVGDPTLPINRLAANWGYMNLEGGVRQLARPEIDAVVLGETPEWEAIEYAQDMIKSGAKKALIILGHVVSEQSGMEYCAEWLKSFISEIPVEFVAAAEPFWSPDAPAGKG